MAVLPPDPVFNLRGDMGYVHSLSFADYEKNYSATLLAATEAGYVHVWDLETNRMKYKQQLGKSILAVHSVGHNIVTQEKSGVLKLWAVNESRYEELKTYECYGGYCRSLLLHDDKLIVPQEKSQLDVIEVNNLKVVGTLVPREDNLGCVMCLERAQINGATYILAGYETGDVILYDLNTCKPCSRLKLHEGTTSLTYDVGTGRAVCGNVSNALQLFTVDKNLNMTLKCEISITNDGCNVVKLRPDRKIIVSGGWDGRLRLFSWKTLRLLVVLTEHHKSITDVQFSPNVVGLWNSKVMAASGADGIISLWNLYN